MAFTKTKKTEADLIRKTKRVKDSYLDVNILEPSVQRITTTAAIINVPENARHIRIKHGGDRPVWIGNVSTIQPYGTNAYPLDNGEYIDIAVVVGNNNTIYGVVDEGYVDLFILGGYTE